MSTHAVPAHWASVMLVAPIFLADNLVGRKPREGVLLLLNPKTQSHLPCRACLHSMYSIQCTSALRKHIQALDALDESCIIMPLRQSLPTVSEEEASTLGLEGWGIQRAYMHAAGECYRSSPREWPTKLSLPSCLCFPESWSCSTACASRKWAT